MAKTVEEKKLELELKKTLKEIAKDADNFVYEDIHDTSLKYLFDNKKDKFVERFINLIAGQIYTCLLKNKPVKYPLKMMEQCYACGEFVTLLFDGKKIYGEDTTLKCFNKKVFSFDIAIPSGTLLLADWFPEGENLFKIKDEDVNCLLGRYNQSKNYAEKQVMHFFVGNTSPTVSQKGNEIIIESPGYYEDEDEEYELFFDETFENKGSVCTDLWWVTGIDMEYYKKLLSEMDDADEKYAYDFMENEAIILNVEPGIYTCTTFYEICDRDDTSKSQLFIKINKKN